MKPVRLVAVDVDGTLMDSEGRLSNPVREALREANDLGLQLAIVSGRNYQGVNYIMNQLGLELWFISSNGAYTANLHLGKVLARHFLKRKDAETVIRIGRSLNAGIFFEREDGVYWEGPKFHLVKLNSVKGIPLKVTEDLFQLESSRPLKITLVGEPEDLPRFFTELSACNLEIDVVQSTDHSLEVNRKGVNKGKALKRLADYLEIPLAEVMAVGDGENDLSMFKVAGTSVAMGNASPEVQQAADLVAPTNDEDGLAWALDLAMDGIQNTGAYPKGGLERMP
ncbi:MAG: Cof-type HAD-IIB family hydrolase [Chloroflexi bacterium]|nr:Cof-type HAD-IIB family hydrolase [Chloroflexota bacterium]